MVLSYGRKTREEGRRGKEFIAAQGGGMVESRPDGWKCVLEEEKSSGVGREEGKDEEEDLEERRDGRNRNRFGFRNELIEEFTEHLKFRKSGRMTE